MSEEARTKQPDEKYCSSCGALVEKDDQFCQQCGTPSGGTGAVSPSRGQDVSQQTPRQDVMVQQPQTKQLDEVQLPFPEAFHGIDARAERCYVSPRPNPKPIKSDFRLFIERGARSLTAFLIFAL
jgi:hypothetical protein